MINILFRVLTISLLSTLVYSRFPFFLSRNKENHFCFNQNEISVCFPKQDSSSLCSKGTALPGEHYLQCILSSTVCDAPGTFSIPKASSAYYTCNLNLSTGTFEKHTASCSGDKFFDPLTLMCLNAEELSISRSISDEPIVNSPVCDKVGPIPDSLNCKGFYFCPEVRSAPLKLYCGPHMYYNEDLKMCTSKLTRSCISKLFEWEDFTQDRARKNYAAVQATLKLGLLNHGSTSPARQGQENENDVTEPEDTKFEDVQYDHQLTSNGPFTKLKQKFKNHRGFFAKPIRLFQNLFFTKIKRLLTLPWRLRRARLQNICRKLNEHSPNFNQENFENLGQHEEPMNDNAVIQQPQRIFPFTRPFLNRFPHEQKKTSEFHPLEDDVTEEEDSPEEIEIEKQIKGKGHRKPINTLLDRFPAEQSGSEYDSLEDDLTEEEDNLEEIEIEKHIKGKGHRKPINTFLDRFPAEQSGSEYDLLEDDLPEEEYSPEETKVGKHVKGKGHVKDIYNSGKTEFGMHFMGKGLRKPITIVHNFLHEKKKDEDVEEEEEEDDDDDEEEKEEDEEEDEEDETQDEEEQEQEEQEDEEDEEEEEEEAEHDHDEEHDEEKIEFRTRFNENGVKKPVKSFDLGLNLQPFIPSKHFNVITKREHDPQEDDEREEERRRELLIMQELMVDAQKEKPEETNSSNSSKEKVRTKISHAIPGEKRKRKHQQLQNDWTKEKENPEETKFKKRLKGKGREKLLFQDVLRHQRKRKQEPKQYGLTEGQENPEEIEFGIHFKRGGLRKRIKTFVNRVRGEKRIREHLALQQQENPEENKLRRHFKKKGHLKPIKIFNHILGEKEEEIEQNQSEGDLTTEQENPEKTKFKKRFKRKLHRKPISTTKSVLDEQKETDDLTEEQEKPEQTKFVKRFKGKGHAKSRKTLGEQKEEANHDQPEDDLTEKEKSPEETTEFSGLITDHAWMFPPARTVSKSHSGEHDTTEEQEEDEGEEEANTAESEFENPLKGKGLGRSNKTNRFSDENRNRSLLNTKYQEPEEELENSTYGMFAD